MGKFPIEWVFNNKALLTLTIMVKNFDSRKKTEAENVVKFLDNATTPYIL